MSDAKVSRIPPNGHAYGRGISSKHYNKNGNWAASTKRRYHAQATRPHRNWTQSPARGHLEIPQRRNRLYAKVIQQLTGSRSCRALFAPVSLYSDGHRQLTGFFYPGDVFGVDSDHYSSSAEAVTAVTLRRCGRGFGEDVRPSETPPVHGALRSALDNAQACIFPARAPDCCRTNGCIPPGDSRAIFAGQAFCPAHVAIRHCRSFRADYPYR